MTVDVVAGGQERHKGLMSRHEKLLWWSRSAYLVLMLAENGVLKENTDLTRIVVILYQSSSRCTKLSHSVAFVSPSMEHNRPDADSVGAEL